MQQIYRRTPCWSVFSVKLLCLRTPLDGCFFCLKISFLAYSSLMNIVAILTKSKDRKHIFLSIKKPFSKWRLAYVSRIYNFIDKKIVSDLCFLSKSFLVILFIIKIWLAAIRFSSCYKMLSISSSYCVDCYYYILDYTYQYANFHCIFLQIRPQNVLKYAEKLSLNVLIFVRKNVVRSRNNTKTWRGRPGMGKVCIFSKILMFFFLVCQR